MTASIGSKADGAFASSSIQNEQITEIVVSEIIFSDIEPISMSLKHESAERCKCEENSAKTGSLICGVVLALSFDDAKSCIRLVISSKLEWQNIFAPLIYLDTHKEPPRVIL